MMAHEPRHETKPSGVCPKCGVPLDDHDWKDGEVWLSRPRCRQ